MNTNAIEHAGGKVRQLILRDKVSMSSIFRELKPDAVIHLAARVGVRESMKEPHRYLETNVIGTQNLLDCCAVAGVRQVVLASTSSVYGNLAHQVETATPQPRSVYAASKLGMEALGHVYHALHGMNVAILRLFSVYGERVRYDLMVHRLMESIAFGTEVTMFNGGALWRDWTYVGDVVQGIRAALDVQGCELINLGRGEPVRLTTILELLEAISSKSANIAYAGAPLTEPRVTQADIGKAQCLLGYSPQVGIEEGLRRTWAWYQEAMFDEAQ